MFLKRSVSVIFQNCDLRQKVHFERLGYAVLFLTYRYLCVNSALHYLRPPLRGLKPNAISWESSKVAFRITTPLWGLKRTQVHCRIVFNTPLEFLPHSGDIKLTYLQLHTTNQKSSDSKEWLLFYISILAIIIYPTYVIAFTYI